MKTLIATLSISAALLAPAAAFAATTTEANTAPTVTPAVTAPAATTPVTTQDRTNAARVAMNKQTREDMSFGRQASDDRDGLSRIQEQSRQLGATN